MSDETTRPESVNILDRLPALENPKDTDKLTKAVALEHEKSSGDAPRITATGKGAVAEQILQLAFAHGVKVREDADLTEILAQLDVDSPIPLEAYAAVAEILAYLYRTNDSQTKDTRNDEPHSH